MTPDDNPRHGMIHTRGLIILPRKERRTSADEAADSRRSARRAITVFAVAVAVFLIVNVVLLVV